MVWLLCLPIALVYLVATRQLITFFINDPSETALRSGMQFLYVVVPFYFIMSVKLVADGVLRGSGLMKRFMVTTFTDFGAARVLGKRSLHVLRLSWYLVCMARRLDHCHDPVSSVLPKELSGEHRTGGLSPQNW